MKTNLLKISKMKQFYSMMDEPDVPSSFWQYNSLQVGDTEFLSKSDKAERVEKRNQYFYDRKKFITSVDRWAYAEKLLQYIKKRYEREKQKKKLGKKKIIKSKDGKRVVGMYPENLREVTFKHNDKYESFYNNDDYHGDLSPSRIFDQTEDKSGLERWRLKVGEEEADRIVEESKAIGTSLHTYIENSVMKFSNIKHLKGLPLPNPEAHELHHDLVTNMGNVILEKGLKDKLEEVWGLEANIHYENIYRGIIDMVGIYEGKQTIIDFKTKRTIPQRKYQDRFFKQLTAYAVAHNWRCKTNIRKGVLLFVDRDLNFERYSIEGKEFEYYKKLFFQDVDKVFVGRAKDIKKAMDINNQKRKEIKIFL